MGFPLIKKTSINVKFNVFTLTVTNLSKMSSMTSKTLRIGVSKPTAKLNTNKSKIQHNFSANIEYLSRHRKGQRAFVEENENKLLIFLSKTNL